ncbi:MAG: imelysin family protein [Kofleriaceae bacterium]|nr:imelysin family protein [Kofleriaceae bacterium]
MFQAGCLAVVMLVAASACSSPSSPAKQDAPEDGFDRAALLTHLAKNVLLPMQTTFAERAAALPAAIEAHCNALDGGDGSSTLEPARIAFGMAVDAWQKADAVIVGPAAADMLTLRGRIYGWPNSSPCEIDRDVASRWADPSSYNIETEFVSTRSLTAIEFLLWPPTNNHNCFDIPVGWNDLGANLPRARCRLAHAIAVDVAAQAQTLAHAWKDGYADELATSANGQEALNHISDGMFYVDKMVKDMKLGEAAGIAINACDVVQEPCPREVELRFSDRSSFAIRANLVALREVFSGKTATMDGLGFDDWLAFANQAELSTRMLQTLDDAIADANALPDSFLDALTTRYAEVAALHGSVKLFTDDLKSQFLTVLALEIPNDVATDND